MGKNSTLNQIQKEKFVLAFEVIELRLSAIWNAIDSIDTKTNILLGFGSTIIIIIAGFYSLESYKWTLTMIFLFGIAAFAYIILVTLCILSYKIRNWDYRPEPKTLLMNCKDLYVECIADKK